MAEARIQMQCEGCGKFVTFPTTDLGTVQECPECGGYLDVPELSRVPTVYDQQTDAYARQSEETDRQLRRSAEQQTVTERQLHHTGEIQAETERQLRRTAEQQDQIQAQLDQRDRLAALEEQLLARAGGLLDRWEALAARVEQVLSASQQRDRE